MPSIGAQATGERSKEVFRELEAKLGGGSANAGSKEGVFSTFPGIREPKMSLQISYPIKLSNFAKDELPES